jgi:hypothetical protein
LLFEVSGHLSGVPLTLWPPYSFDPKNQSSSAVSNGFRPPMSVSNLPQLPQPMQLSLNQRPTDRQIALCAIAVLRWSYLVLLAVTVLE